MRVSARSYAQTKIRQAASATRGNRGEATGRDGGRETQTTAVSIDSLVQMEDLFALLVPLHKGIGARATRRRWSSERFFFYLWFLFIPRRSMGITKPCSPPIPSQWCDHLQHFFSARGESAKIFPSPSAPGPRAHPVTPKPDGRTHPIYMS